MPVVVTMVYNSEKIRCATRITGTISNISFISSESKKVAICFKKSRGMSTRGLYIARPTRIRALVLNKRD